MVLGVVIVVLLFVVDDATTWRGVGRRRVIFVVLSFRVVAVVSDVASLATWRVVGSCCCSCLWSVTCRPGDVLGVVVLSDGRG
jgi:hypothetical protein